MNRFLGSPSHRWFRNASARWSAAGSCSPSHRWFRNWSIQNPRAKKVRHRIDGLETYVPFIGFKENVRHRIDGLEICMMIMMGVLLVRHRIDGLEKCLSQSANLL